jgi:hypothetical protein
MMSVKLKLTLTMRLAVVVLALHTFGGVPPLVAQTPLVTQPGGRAEQSDGQRGDVFSSDFFTETRPAGATQRPTGAVYRDRHPPSARRPGPATSTRREPPRGKVLVRLGVTLGRGRPATDVDIKDDNVEKVTICAERRGDDCMSSRQMVVERISDKTPISDGTPIQMMIEYLAYRDATGAKQASGRVGYIYVINRVQYSDGTTSQPKLIFPIKRIFGGENRVLPGKIVMLPDPKRLWLITRNKKATQEFETYLIIISPKPLTDSSGHELQLGNTPLELDQRLVANWVKWWGGGEIQSDLEWGLGRLFTKREQSAGGDPTETNRDTEMVDADLKQDDPQPQIGFRKAVTLGSPILITIKLHFKDYSALHLNEHGSLK